MIRNTVLTNQILYYALGNSPAVYLTQDLPPEQDADVLLLGCGDARNILFTCFADNARKIDVTCCDIEPGIHARNVLLYSLLLEDTASVNIGRIWNIYYHWKLDKDSVELLETQTEKLLQLSVSIDEWDASVLGARIRFCNARSLACVRAYWIGFQSRDLSPLEKENRKKQLEAAINRAKILRTETGYSGDWFRRIHTGLPVSEAVEPLSEIAKRWWDFGTTLSSSSSASKPTDLNPAFLYSPNPLLTLHYDLSPLHGFPLSTAYVPIARGPFHFDCNGVPTVDDLVDCAMSHFKEWASAFKRNMMNKSVIRIFSGDALSFGLALGGWENIFSDNMTSSPLGLHPLDYGNEVKSAPCTFDVIDASNLVDHIGPLNIITIGANLLKYHESSAIYLDTFVLPTSSIFKQLSDFLGADVKTISMLLGLIPPDLFTNSTDCYEQEMMLHEASEIFYEEAKVVTQVRARLRWKRLREYQTFSGCPHIHVEARSLAKLLMQVYDVMFVVDDPLSLKFVDPTDPGEARRFLYPAYNRASFAFLLRSLRATVVTNWDQCIGCIYNSAFAADPLSTIRLNYAVDLLMNMYQFGVDNGRFPDLDPADLSNAILAPFLPEGKELPNQLCVTLRVRREQLKTFTLNNRKELSFVTLAVIFEGGDPGQMQWSNYFSAVQIVFGKWQKQTMGTDPCIVEDGSQLAGAADMFVSVIVPTFMLLQSKKSVPHVKCGIIPNSQNFTALSQVFGSDHCFVHKEVTSNDVSITRYMPGMSGHPSLASSNTLRHNPESAYVTVRLLDDGSKIDVVSRSIYLESEADRAVFADTSSMVRIKFLSPFTALISIANSLKLKLDFPIPVSVFNFKAKIKRKSAYIEIESPLFDPLREVAVSLYAPVFLSKDVHGTISPIPWISARINLDAMPIVDLTDPNPAYWLNMMVSHMFSTREERVRSGEYLPDPRTNLKVTLFSILMQFVGLEGRRITDIYGLNKVGGGPCDGVQALIFPSCLRVDLANHSAVLDCAIIPLTLDMLFMDPKAAQFLGNLSFRLSRVNVNPAEFLAWKAIMPALVERCRTATSWAHTRDCAYLKESEVPIRVKKDGISPICSCGVGKFPPEYLKDKMKTLPDLDYMIQRYATRAAIAPIFPVPYVENCFSHFEEGVTNHNLNGNGTCSSEQQNCNKCGTTYRKSAPPGEQGLLRCSGCKKVWYCSIDCQKADRKEHKQKCFAV